MISATDLKNYLYCPRIIFYKKIHNLKEPIKNNILIKEGIKKHITKLNKNKYICKFLEGFIERKVEFKIYNEKLKLIGVIDELYFYEDELIIIEYKNSIYKGEVNNGELFQLIFYSLLVRNEYKKKINKGYIFYMKGKKKIAEIIFEKEDYLKCIKIIKNIFKIIDDEANPEVLENHEKCRGCEYKRLCFL
ncbi:CRISPR-associated exonuclease Cas4 [Cetobacterium ceti]|uniref:CRISPR-associated exonuclease Cas4 n=1 Tax=Cetobacterium ceti TaxID=180163 RepID=A0A1T4K4Z5_9FUSO|nr:CRISPR-associated protein Cas4 [Cetobacterium ceti]SJZ37504.1 CRISPR-associated exonuclease Cas4 [Cetobacterium ceti]